MKGKSRQVSEQVCKQGTCNQGAGVLKKTSEQCEETELYMEKKNTGMTIKGI